MFDFRRFKKLRESYDMSLDDLVFIINKRTGEKISKMTISNWERGKSAPRGDLLGIVCDFFKVDLAYFKRKKR